MDLCQIYNQVGIVCIPETLCPLDDDDIDQFLDHIDTTSCFEDSGVQHFIEHKHFLHTLIQ